MNSNTLSLASDTEYDSHVVCSDDEFPNALESWTLQDFSDILGGQTQ